MVSGTSPFGPHEKCHLLRDERDGRDRDGDKRLAYRAGVFLFYVEERGESMYKIWAGHVPWQR